MFRTISILAAATLTLAMTAACADKVDNAPAASVEKAPVAAAPAAAATHTATGVVTKTDAAGGKVEIEHGPVKTLDWPAMKMEFAVKDKALYSKLIVGKTVEFQLAEKDNEYVVVGVR